jgi:hypothetical protein
MIDTSNYTELEEALREMPKTWVPALLAVLVQRSGVWRDLIGLQSFIAKAWERK